MASIMSALQNLCRCDAFHVVAIVAFVFFSVQLGFQLFSPVSGSRLYDDASDIKSSENEVIESYSKEDALGIFSIGMIGFAVVAVCGCVGHHRQNKSLLQIYAGCCGTCGFVSTISVMYSIGALATGHSVCQTLDTNGNEIPSGLCFASELLWGLLAVLFSINAYCAVKSLMRPNEVEREPVVIIDHAMQNHKIVPSRTEPQVQNQRTNVVAIDIF